MCSVAAAQMYKWVDEKGVVHMSNSPPANKKLRKKTKKIKQTKRKKSKSSTSSYQDYLKQEQNRGKQRNAQNTRRKNKVVRVTMYTTSWCPACESARQYFRARGISFTDYNVEKDEAAAKRKKDLHPGGGVPLVVINGKVFLGFSASAFDAALDQD